MNEWHDFLKNEARALAILVPLMAIAGLVGVEAGQSVAAGGLSESPVSPVPTSTPPGAVGPFLQDYLWLLLLVALLILLLVGGVLWRRRGTS